MTPVPASKKFWVFDGSVEQYASVFESGSVHIGRDCTYCHGGTDAGTARAVAHTTGFDKFATASPVGCQDCHAGVAMSAAGGLHTTLGGYQHILAQRGFDFDDPVARARFDAQCTKCHTADPADATPEGWTNCGQCHVSVPDTAGGGLLAGHAFRKTPSMDNNCTACHGSRVKDEYYGQNNALLGRNRTAYDADSPWKDAAFALVPDVHKAGGHDCTFCHDAGEMHGEGHPEAPTGDRYHVAGTPACEGCHPGLVGVNAFHRSSHLQQMDCQVCHAQPYKNCFGCHTDVTAQSVAYFKINEGDPTLAARKAASSNPATVFPDALMTLRVGKNPRWGEPGQRKYALLRHVPIDADTFSYSGANEVGGLVPGMTALPTWKRATPHNIVRSAPIASSCANCHFGEYARFWLTDALGDADGWVPGAYAADEAAANAPVLQGAPVDLLTPPP